MSEKNYKSGSDGQESYSTKNLSSPKKKKESTSIEQTKNGVEDTVKSVLSMPEGHEDKNTALEMLRTAFQDVADETSLATEFPDWWKEVLKKQQWEMPVGVILDGRRDHIPEKHLRRFAYEILSEMIQKEWYKWIVRFLGNENTKIDTPEQVLKFFKNLATTSTY